MNQIQVFKNADIGQVRIVEHNGQPYFVGKDVSDILGYQNGSRDINRHVDEEDRAKAMVFDGNQNKETIIINESGLYSLILSSKLPSAKEFKRWVTSEVIPSIRKTGKYSARKEVDEAKMLNAKVRFARELQRIADRANISDTYKQILIAQAAEALTGVQMPLPKSEGRHYSAAEVGEMCGVSAQKIGRLSNKYELKTKEYGEWFHDKAKYSDKEVETFRYNDKAVERFKELITNEQNQTPETL